MCDAFCGALQRRGIAPLPLLWPPTKTSAKFKFVFHRLDHVHDPIHSMLPPKKVLRCCNAHPAANNQKRNAFFISGFRDTLTQSLNVSKNLQTFYEINKNNFNNDLPTIFISKSCWKQRDRIMGPAIYVLTKHS